MKTQLEPEDIQAITDGLYSKLKPLISTSTSQAHDLMDIKELCDYLKVTRQWVHERTHLKEIPYIKLSNKQLRFRKRDIDRWLDSLQVPVITAYKGKLQAA